MKTNQVAVSSLIVAYNASTDRAAKVAAARGTKVVPVEKRVIVVARNGGARAASGESLCFVDADTVRIACGTLERLAKFMGQARHAAGATGVTLKRWSDGLVATWGLFIPMDWLTNSDSDTGDEVTLRTAHGI